MNTVDIQKGLEQFAGPGGWNDPDLLVTGLFGKGKSSSLKGRYSGCSLTEYRSQFVLWCMLAAPLMVNLDVRNMDKSVAAILCNKELIAINQDEMGKQAALIGEHNGCQVFKKELSGDRYALCILNRRDTVASFSFALNDALKMHGQWNARDILANRQLGPVKTLAGKLAAHDCVVFVLKFRT